MYMDKFLSSHHCAYRKEYSALHCLLAMLGKWEKMDNGNVFGALLPDLST